MFGISAGGVGADRVVVGGTPVDGGGVVVEGGTALAGGLAGAPATGARVVGTGGRVVPVVGVVGRVEGVTPPALGALVVGGAVRTFSSRDSLTTAVVTPMARRTMTATSNNV